MEPLKFVSIMQVLASQLHFLANRNAELAVPPLFWPVNSIKIGEHVALRSCPSIYFLFYDHTVMNTTIPDWRIFLTHNSVYDTPNIVRNLYRRYRLLEHVFQF